MLGTAFQRITLRIIGGAGAALFMFFFVITWHTPQWVETFAANYIEARVADQVDFAIDGITPPQGQDVLSRYAAKLYTQNEAQIAQFKDALKQQAHSQMARCLEQIRGMTPEMRAKLQAWLDDGARIGIGSLEVENARLVELIQAGYLRVVADLKHDIRIFTASNAAVFLLLLLASFLRARIPARAVRSGPVARGEYGFLRLSICVAPGLAAHSDPRQLRGLCIRCLAGHCVRVSLRCAAESGACDAGAGLGLAVPKP